MSEVKTGQKKGVVKTGQSKAEVKTGEQKQPASEKKGKAVTLVFRHNRTFGLPIGKKMYTFYGREPQEVPESVIKHPDFQHQKHYFVIKK